MRLLDDSLIIVTLLLYCYITASSLSMDHDSAHESLAKAAASVRATSSELKGTVSRHVLPDTISFGALNTLHEASKKIADKSSNDFIAVWHDKLVFSYAISYEKPSTISGKRKSEAEVEEQVDSIMAAKDLQTPKNEQLAVAREVVVRLLRDLKGTQHERLVQSVMVSHRRLKSTDNEPRVVVAARLESGIAVPVAKLKSILGTCWKDGAITINNTSELFSEYALPLSDEGAITETLGHKSLRLVTAVPLT
jgi:hypothetical protein